MPDFDATLSQERLVMGGLLLLLDQIADTAAAGGGDVGDAVALEVVLLADIGALHGHGDPVKTEASRGTEEEALRVLLAGYPMVEVWSGRNEEKRTVVLTGSYPSREPFLRRRWWVLPKVTP